MTCSDLIGAALLAAAEQVEYRHDTRPFLRVKGLARQTTAGTPTMNRSDTGAGIVRW